jgi:hypothetical protein
MEVSSSIQDRLREAAPRQGLLAMIYRHPGPFGKAAGTRLHFGILNSNGAPVMRSPLKQNGVPAASSRLVSATIAHVHRTPVPLQR